MRLNKFIIISDVEFPADEDTKEIISIEFQRALYRSIDINAGGNDTSTLLKEALKNEVFKEPLLLFLHTTMPKN
jgi:hypothetical protein